MAYRSRSSIVAPILFRGLAVLVCTSAGLYYGYSLGPALWGGLGGLVLGLMLVGVEAALRPLPLCRLVGGAVGLTAGLLVGLLASRVIQVLALRPALQGMLASLVVLAATYLGLVVGVRRGARFSWASLVAAVRGTDLHRSVKILDTSVIIDGRIADIVGSGFLEGVLVIPSFVLQELQAVADSSDPLKRNRGRKGLDVLQELKRATGADVEFPEMDFPDIREVDQKLIELAKYRHAPIVTNDFNLNKVAQLRGVQVLNVNELANALKPVVLPGETLRVFLVKEGKEKDQAVAYLDDGTMVVVDGARQLIGTKIEVVVTSHLQTSAGKMIFGVWNEDEQRRRQVYRRRQVE